uniref:Uncharacterized protein n=1 Tax=Rhizophora mucronata TaxID=61149 RepID=A0A2P2N6A3_RHIMU
MISILELVRIMHSLLFDMAVIDTIQRISAYANLIFCFVKIINLILCELIDRYDFSI